MANKPASPKRNLPALKHGYYSRLFKVNEADDLPDDSSSLESEIVMLRVMIHRTMHLAEGLDDLVEARRVLDALGAASARLANLLRAQKHLQGNRSGVADEISIAIQQVNQELRSKI